MTDPGASSDPPPSFTGDPAAGADELVGRALVSQDEAYLRAEQALLEQATVPDIEAAVARRGDPLGPLLSTLATNFGPGRRSVLVEVDRYLDTVERGFRNKVAPSPPAHAVTANLSQRFGPGLSEALAMRLVSMPGAPTWRNRVALGYLERHPNAAATAALLRFASTTSVNQDREFAVRLLRSSGDPALAQKVAAERQRLAAAGQHLPAAVANLA